MKEKDTKRASRIHAQQLPDDILIPCQICLFENGCEDTWPRCGYHVEVGGQRDGAENH